MRELLILIILLVSMSDARSQIVIADKNGHVTETIDTRAHFFVSNDTVTRFSLGFASSPDRCKSISIIRSVYRREHNQYQEVFTRTVRIYTGCESLWRNEADIYCLRVEKLKVNNGKVRILITDSDDRKLRRKLDGSGDFEDRLRREIDMFIRDKDCSGGRVE